MASPPIQPFSKPFAILTPRLVIIPTPIAVHIATYRALYGALHADAGFCRMGFGERFPVSSWNDEDTRDMIETRDLKRCWQRRGLGDFAVGLRPQPVGGSGNDSKDDAYVGVSTLRGEDFEQLVGPDMTRMEEIRWVGYTGVRDATTTSIPPSEEGDAPLPHWLEMIELRYGVSPEFWGKGIAEEASRAVMHWAVCEKGAKRFIADTERDNRRSGRVLEKLGFRQSGTNYWKEPEFVVEWEFLSREGMRECFGANGLKGRSSCWGWGCGRDHEMG